MKADKFTGTSESVSNTPVGQTRSLPPQSNASHSAVTQSTHNETTRHRFITTVNCPGCDTEVPTSESCDTHELVCPECDIVIKSQLCDTSNSRPQLTTNTAEKSTTRQGVSQTTATKVGNGLGSIIHANKTDGNGNFLNSNSRKHASRLAFSHALFSNSQKNNLNYGLDIVSRISTALGLPKSTQEVAAMYFRQAYKKHLAWGRTIEGLATASVVIGSRDQNHPRTLSEVAHVSRIGENTLANTVTLLKDELGIAVEPTTPMEHIERFGTELNINHRTITYAREILTAEDNIQVVTTSGRCPTSLAAAAIYLAAKELEPNTHTQTDVSQATNVSQNTISRTITDIKTPTVPTALTKKSTEPIVC